MAASRAAGSPTPVHHDQPSIDSLAGGALVQRVVRNGRTVSLAALQSAIPTSWMSIQGDAARLDATVVLTPTTLLDVEGVKTLQLAGDASGAEVGGRKALVVAVTQFSAPAGFARVR